MYIHKNIQPYTQTYDITFKHTGRQTRRQIETQTMQTYIGKTRTQTYIHGYIQYDIHINIQSYKQTCIQIHPGKQSRIRATIYTYTKPFIQNNQIQEVNHTHIYT